MAAVQSIPDDEIAAELAASWSPDEPAGTAPRTRPVAPVHRPVARRSAPDLAGLRRIAERTRPVALAHEQTLPLSPAFAGLLPGGLPRGATVVVGGTPAAGHQAARGATSLALALAAPASAAGSWVALVGLPATGLVAAAELGLPFERLVAIDAPPAEHWATVAGALVGAFDILLLAPPGTARASGRGRAGVRAAEVRRLTARSRERGTVLVLLAAPGLPRTPESERTVGFDPDLRVTVGSSRWEGLGRGHGLLCSRRVTVEVAGRRAAARARRAELWLPDPEGQVRLVDPPEQAPVHLSTVPAAWSDAG